MRLLLALMIIMGVAIIAGLIAVVIIAIGRVSQAMDPADPATPTDAATPAQAQTITLAADEPGLMLPDGGRIEQVLTVGAWLYVQWRGPEQDRLFLVDPATGRILREVGRPPPATP